MGLDKALYNFARRGIVPALQNVVGSGPISVDSAGKLITTDVGRTWFVSGNFGSDNNDGSSWDKAFATLAAAITANNADVAADKYGWATRNKIYLSADTTTESLVAFPNKCDVIGVGSYDANDQPGITGMHAPVNSGNYGTRFFNIWFKGTAVASPIVTLASTSSGIQFVGCTFDATAGTITYAISATASPFLKVIGCDFRGAFATGVIYFGAGEAGRTIIEGNVMSGSLGKGIVLASTTTASWAMIARGNFIQCAGQWVDDDSDSGNGILYVIDNRAITAIDCATYTAGFDMNLLRAAGNIQTGSNAGDCDTVPHLLFA